MYMGYRQMEVCELRVGDFLVLEVDAVETGWYYNAAGLKKKLPAYALHVLSGYSKNNATHIMAGAALRHLDIFGDVMFTVSEMVFLHVAEGRYLLENMGGVKEDVKSGRRQTEWSTWHLMPGGNPRRVDKPKTTAAHKEMAGKMLKQLGLTVESEGLKSHLMRKSMLAVTDLNNVRTAAQKRAGRFTSTKEGSDGSKVMESTYLPTFPWEAARVLAGYDKEPGLHGVDADHVIAANLCPPSAALCDAVYGGLIGKLAGIVESDRESGKSRLWMDVRGVDTLRHLAAVFISGVALFREGHKGDPAWCVYAEYSFFKGAPLFAPHLAPCGHPVLPFVQLLCSTV